MKIPGSDTAAGIFASKSLPLWGGAPRSESAMPMIAGGNHTFIHKGGRAKARSEEVATDTISRNFAVFLFSQKSKIFASFPKGEAILQYNIDKSFQIVYSIFG